MKQLVDLERPSLGGRQSLFLDAGDSFFSARELPPSRISSEIERANLIARAYREIGVTHFTPGEKDFASGIETLRELGKISKMIFVASNLHSTNGQLLFSKSDIVSVGGNLVGVFGLVGEEAMQGVDGIKVTDPTQVGKVTVKELRDEGTSVVVLLSHLGLQADRELAKTLDVDFIIGSHSMDVLPKGERVNRAFIVQPHHDGQQIGIIDFDPAAAENPALRLVELGKELDRPNEVVTLMEAFRAQVRLRGIESPGIHEATSENPYVAHPYYCRTCHPKQYDYWAKTKHASAYLVLFSKNQHFDLLCVTCHTLGFQSPGGFQKISEPITLTREKKGQVPFIETFLKGVFRGKERIDLDSREQPERFKKLQGKFINTIHEMEKGDKIKMNFLGVQCEHCHGNRNGHPDSSVPTVKRVKEESCRICHRPPNDEHFNFSVIQQVACPLSKRL